MRTSSPPFGDAYEYEIGEAAELLLLQDFVSRHTTPETTIVAVQGLGFVGAGMVAALAEARTLEGAPRFAVIGVDLPDEDNYWKIARVRDGQPPIWSNDPRMAEAYKRASQLGNVTATFSDHAYACADVVVVDVNLDINKSYDDAREYTFGYDAYVPAIEAVARSVTEDTLVVIETTVPPGTTANVIRPIFEKAFVARNLDKRRLFLAHSYERVMPGPRYLDSITNFYRVFAGTNEASSSRARTFFETFINTADFPLSELASTTESELAKVMENSYRATNIAFMQEWTEFAEAAEVDLFAVVEAIRVRATHRNIMAPGFGVGGYCLPKDPLLADWAFQAHFGGGRRLDMSLEAVQINDRMPLHTFRVLREMAGGLTGHRVALLGVSYLAGIADTRSSPSALFYDRCIEASATVSLHDPMLAFWPEKGVPVHQDFEAFGELSHDTAVFAVRHPEYLRLTAQDIGGTLVGIKCVIDANNVITDAVAADLCARGIRVAGIGKGHWNGRSCQIRQGGDS